MSNTENTRGYFNSNRAKWVHKLEEGCINCGATATELHHVVPLSLGGTNKDTNIVPMCAECHGKIHNSNLIRLEKLRKEGLKRAIERGVKLGRPKKDINEAIERYRNTNYSIEKIAKMHDISVVTLQKAIKEIGIKRGTHIVEYPENWEEVYNGWASRLYTPREACSILGISSNKFYYYITRYKKEMSQ